jgi:hypothetical protein
MRKVVRRLAGAGFVTAALAAIMGIILYPRARWLFVLPVAVMVLVMLAMLTDEGPSPIEVADRAEALLSGNSWGWDVDDYEHLNPKHERLKNLWSRTMSVGGLPERWAGLSDREKSQMREIIAEMRRIEMPKS